MLPELETLGYQMPTKKAQLCASEAAYLGYQLQEAKRGCPRVGLLPSFRSQLQRLRDRFRVLKCSWIALPQKARVCGISKGLRTPAQEEEGEGGQLSPILIESKQKDIKGFNPNFEAMEMPYDIPVQTIGPCSHRMAHLSKIYGGNS